MDKFQELQASRDLLIAKSAPVWGAIRAAVRQLVDSYNRIDEGRANPATVDDSAEDRIKVDRQSDNILVSVTVTFINQGATFQIGVFSESWASGPQPKLIKQPAKVSYDMVPDIEHREVYLLDRETEKVLTPFALVEDTLYRFLVG
jgi:hypothetical protein